MLIATVPAVLTSAESDFLLLRIAVRSGFPFSADRCSSRISFRSASSFQSWRIIALVRIIVHRAYHFQSASSF